MATLTPTLTLASSDMNGDVLNLSVTDSLSILGQVTTKQVATSTSPAVFAKAANYTKSYVYLKNLSATAAEIITIENLQTISANVDSGDATIIAVSPTTVLPAMRFGASVTGTNVPAATTVLSITNATTFEMTANATGSADPQDITIATDEYFKLAPGEFAFFPWIAGSAANSLSRIDLGAVAAQGTPTLEVRIYQEAAA